jgi:hypothetical protein
VAISEVQPQFSCRATTGSTEAITASARVESKDFGRSLASDTWLGQAAGVQLRDRPFPKSKNPEPI